MRNALLLLLLFIFTSFNKPSVREIRYIKKPIPKKLNYSIQVRKNIRVKFKTWKIPSNKSKWTDKDWLAKMLMTEVHTTDSASIEAIYLFAYTAINHTKILDTTLQAVITRPGAFSGVNKKHYKYWNQEPTDTHKRIALEVLRKGVPKEYNKLYAFCACQSKIVSNKTRAWFNKLPLIKTIEVLNIPLTFYNYPYEIKSKKKT